MTRAIEIKVDAESRVRAWFTLDQLEDETFGGFQKTQDREYLRQQIWDSLFSAMQGELNKTELKVDYELSSREVENLDIMVDELLDRWKEEDEEEAEEGYPDPMDEAKRLDAEFLVTEAERDS